MISNLYSISTSRQVISQYEQVVAAMPEKEINKKITDAKKFNEDIADNIYHDGLEYSLCNENGLMCYVDIPSISVYLPVYYGATDETLSKGAAYIENTSLPVGGKSTHSVISAHTGLPSAEMFSKLDQVKMGEVFYIHVLDEILAYKVNEIRTVKPFEVGYLTVFPDEDYLTLLTCTPYGVNDHRLLVRGERIEYNPEETKSDNKPGQGSKNSADSGLADEIHHQTILIVIVIALALVLYLTGLIWFFTSFIIRPRYLRKKTEGTDSGTRKTD